jgi:hypothetical protein
VLAQQPFPLPANANNPAVGIPPAVASAQLDYSDELIALIQQTLHARIWDVNGGTGTIRYFPPSLALVVSAPQHVHEDLADLLFQLRAARGP